MTSVLAARAVSRQTWCHPSSAPVAGPERPMLGSVDHSHSTNTVRGILCQHCNNMLGMAKDRHEIFERAIAYLKGASNG